MLVIKTKEFPNGKLCHFLVEFDQDGTVTIKLYDQDDSNQEPVAEIEMPLSTADEFTDEIYDGIVGLMGGPNRNDIVRTDIGR
jgi:hypothetical protein